MDLSFVLISRNQAWNIRRLLNSVLEGGRFISRWEIAVVDSASTDATTELACQYPVNVLRLRPDQLLTPAAGRYIGYRHTSGQLICFLDGDMELFPGWLEQACQIFSHRPEVAALTGNIVDWPQTENTRKMIEPHITAEPAVHEILNAAGAAMYRRSVLNEVGSFNPYLHSDEEPELCLRIRSAGYQILAIDYPMVLHHSGPSEAISTLIARWSRNLYLGQGQILRYYLGSKLFWPYVMQRGFAIVPTLGILFGLCAFSWGAATGKWFGFGIWSVLLIAFCTADAFRKKSVHRTLASLVKRLLIVEGTIRGFSKKPLDPATYPARVDFLQTGCAVEYRP
jgi:glycosyltransferase involved in cell wall biosynthesis